jgi:DNA polymerase phi
MFELYNGNSDAMSVLSEINIVCDQILGKKSGSAEDMAALLTEVLLALISKPSSLLRKLTQQIFGAFSDQLTPMSLQVLFDVSGINRPGLDVLPFAENKRT